MKGKEGGLLICFKTESKKASNLNDLSLLAFYIHYYLFWL